MIHSAESKNQIRDAQYWGRNRRQAQSSVLKTVFYYDIHRQLRKNYTSTDDDMKANFDHEIPHYVAAELDQLGCRLKMDNILYRLLHLKNILLGLRMVPLRRINLLPNIVLSRDLVKV